MPRDWSTLNPYARRKYKFVQADSYAGVTDNFANMPDGVCLGVVMNWIREKLATSNSVYRATGLLRSSEKRQFSNPVNPVARLKQGIAPPANSLAARFIGKSKSGERNRRAMAAGAGNQEFYYSHGGNVDLLASEMGLLEEIWAAPHPANSFHAGITTRLHPESIMRAALELPRGRAALIELVQTAGPGHAIAFYRSRGNTLYFFDPNAGVYEVVPATEQNILALVNAWIGVYRAADQITWETPNDNWCRVYRLRNPEDAAVA